MCLHLKQFKQLKVENHSNKYSRIRISFLRAQIKMQCISTCNYVLLAVNHFFGFGLMNAEAMINRSLSWKTVPDQVVCRSSNITVNGRVFLTNGPRQANLVLIAYASSEGSGEPAHPRSLARTFAARSYKQ